MNFGRIAKPDKIQFGSDLTKMRGGRPMQTCLTALAIFLLLFCGTTDAQDLGDQIRHLKSGSDVECMWELISTPDQAHRGLNTVDSIDNLNFKRMVLLIQYHGYPKSSIVPNMVFTHQRSAYVREHYFRILQDAYNDGNADEYWFLHNVRGMHRERFGFDLLQPTTTNYEQLLSRLSPFLNDSLTYDLAPFDPLFSTYITDVQRITNSPANHRWVNKEGDRISIHSVDDKLYLFKLWGDGSYGLPQQIRSDKSTGKYTFVEPANKAYLAIDTSGNLTIKGGNWRPQFYRVVN
jgi:hypothetical protein